MGPLLSKLGRSSKNLDKHSVFWPVWLLRIHEKSYVDSRISGNNVMISQSVITHFSKWRSRWNSLHPRRGRHSNATGLLVSKRGTGLLAMAGAAAMDSQVGELWLGNGCEPGVGPATRSG
jgi:hypothetical protein